MKNLIKKWLISLKLVISRITQMILNVNLLTVIVILGLVIVSLHNVVIYEKVKKENSKMSQAIKALELPNDTVIISDYCLNKLIEFRAPNPYVALAQFKIESGHFTSKLFRENNNPMGMKFPTRRPTTAKYSKNGYAYYDNLDDAILDYIFYSLYQTKGTVSDSEYIDTVLKSYAEDSSYKKKVTNLSNKLKSHGKNR